MNMGRTLFVGGVVLLARTLALGQTWDGGGGNDNFNAANNWNPNAVPPNNGTAILVFDGAVRLTPQVNLNFDVSGITFAAGAGQFRIGTPNNSVLTLRGGGVSNNSANGQTFTVPVTVAANTSITGATDELAFESLAMGNHTVTIGGTSPTTIGAISGSGRLIKNGAGGLFVFSPTTNEYDLTVNAGIVLYNAPATFGPLTSDIDVVGGTLAVLDLTLDGARLDVAPAATFVLSPTGTLEVAAGGEATISGAYTTSDDAIYRVTGTGLLNRPSKLTAGNLTIGGDARLEVIGGGTASPAGLFVGGVTGPGTVVLDGTGSALTSAFIAVGEMIGSQGTVTFRDRGSATVSGGLRVANGIGSTGTVLVHNGATVTAASLAVSQTGSTGEGTVTITGPGSKLTTVDVTSEIGSAAGGGTAQVNVEDGGQLLFGGPLIIGSTGALHINGGTLEMGLGDGITNNGGVLNLVRGRLLLGENLLVGGGGLLGTNVNLTSGRELSVPATAATLVSPTGTLTIDGGRLISGTLVDGGGTIDFRRGELSITGAAGLGVGMTGPLGANLNIGPGMTLAVSAATTVQTDGVLSIDGGTFSTGTLQNGGSVLVESGVASVLGAAGNAPGGQLFVGRTLSLSGTLINAVGGRVELAGGTGRITGPGAIQNNGLITGDGTITNPVTNAASGEIRAEAGKTLAFVGTQSPNAGRWNLQGGALDFATPVTNAAAGRIIGRGSLNFAGGLSNAGEMHFSGGLSDVTGSVTMSAGSRLITSGAGTSTFYGPFVHNGAEVRTAVDSRTVFFGPVTGAGPFLGTGLVHFEGGYSPGNSPALVSSDSKLVFGDDNVLTIEIGGKTAGTEYDRVAASGDVSLDGVLELQRINGFSPALGDQFDVITWATRSGRFDTISGVDAGGGIALAPQYRPDGLRLTTTYFGDANLDLKVSFADFQVMERSFGLADLGWTDADFTGDGLVAYDDFRVLYEHFGLGTGRPPTAADRAALDAFAAAHVPEPSGFAALGAVIAFSSRRRIRRG